MEIPSRDFYRYLTLCSLRPEEIHDIFWEHLLALPPNPQVYYREQAEWAQGLVGTGTITVSSAMRLAQMHDMWQAHKRRKAGTACRTAFHLAAQQRFRQAIEALLIAGYKDWEVQKAINYSITHTCEIDSEDVAAYRRYFFNPSILSADSCRYLAMKSEWIRIGLLGLEPDLLEHYVGLRYRAYDDIVERAKDRARHKFLLTLESMPLRTDREGVKSFSAFLGSLKTLEHDAGSQDIEAVPLVKLLRGEHIDLEVMN